MMDVWDFMQAKWGFQYAPIGEQFDGPEDPFSRVALSEEYTEFEQKLIAGAIRGRLTYLYLWSESDPQLPAEGTGTGYGKTKMMRITERAINADFGLAVLERAGYRRPPLIAAAYTRLDNEDTKGLYPVLYSAVEQWADAGKCPGPDGQSVLAAARARIVERLGCAADDAAAIWHDVERARRSRPGASTLPPLPSEFMSAFCAPDEDAMANHLAEVRGLARQRRGLSYFQAAQACLTAAGVEHVFVLFDQLEYMVTNKGVTRAQRSREIARFRTVFREDPALRDRAHIIFTLHHRASQVLEEHWAVNRLPPFDLRGRNQQAIVVLRGLASPEKISDLLVAYFDDARPEGHPQRGTCFPVDPKVFTTLWEHTSARPGEILRVTRDALYLAAQENRPTVSLGVMERVLDPRTAASGRHAEPAISLLK